MRYNLFIVTVVTGGERRGWLSADLPPSQLLGLFGARQCDSGSSGYRLECWRMGTLTRPGYLWALLSVAATVLWCSGFYLPV
ncbi:hypothetical protein J6590_043552 [Homalodisca vitripennis]|nr:hypothetical protein J6590_043552 [Homalodisca vitripennis]